MVKQHLIPLESQREWREALNGIQHTFGHTWENCFAMHLTTGLKTYLYCFEKENIRIVCPFSEREFYGYTDILKPYGFSGFIGNGECAEFLDYWKDFVRERGYVCGYLGLNPIFDYGSHFDSERIYQYETIYVLDLIPSIDELFANLDSNRKRQLKHWDDIVSNLVFEKSTLEKFFVDFYYDFLRSRNADAVYYFSVETLSFLFNLDNVTLVGIKNADKVIAVSVFTHTADVGEYLFGISLPEGRNHSAALVWYGVHYLKSLRIPILNLGGGGGGMADFKGRFGGKKLPLRCLKQVYRPEVYEMLCRRVNTDPKDMTGYFPAYRKKNFELQTQKMEIAGEV